MRQRYEWRMLEHGHNPYLVIAALAIALMSGFTGLSLTQGASAMSEARRKFVVSMSAVALGSGIWSMHFVAMLGMTLPVPFHYDALVTMMSALVAILLTGIALLLVHFGERTARRITLAGVCVGLGILAMHYIGMSGIQDVRPVYSVRGIVVAVVASLGLCVVSFWISYGRREGRNILLGTVVFGTAVVAVHFVAMGGTHFVRVEGIAPRGLGLSNEVLAFGVTLSSFLISGAFLLMGVTFAAQFSPTQTPDAQTPEPQTPEPRTPETQTAEPHALTRSEPPHSADISDPGPPAGDHRTVGKLPFERDGRTHFVGEDEVAAVRAEGRYTVLYHSSGRLFCPWSISDMAQRLSDPDFVRSHRSYVINTRYVTSFERKKDNGVCYFDGTAHIDKAPVSRSYLKHIRERLGV